MTSILLTDPKYPHNVGSVLRAASCFGAEDVWFTGDRVLESILERGRIPREERLKGYRTVNLYHTNRATESVLKDITGTPIAVELRPNSECLFDFEHPEDAVYIFGPEDGSLGRPVLQQCHRFLVIPTRFCTNLSAAAYIILYDRAFKHFLKTGEKPKAIDLETLVSDDENKSLFVKAAESRLVEQAEHVSKRTRR